jgi:histone deacetylase complex regulatory component SIN3
LYDLLKKERDLPAPGAAEDAVYRKDAEKIIGDTEHVFRIDWVRWFR